MSWCWWSLTCAGDSPYQLLALCDFLTKHWTWTNRNGHNFITYIWKILREKLCKSRKGASKARNGMIKLALRCSWCFSNMIFHYLLPCKATGTWDCINSSHLHPRIRPSSPQLQQKLTNPLNIRPIRYQIKESTIKLKYYKKKNLSNKASSSALP